MVIYDILGGVGGGSIITRESGSLKISLYEDKRLKKTQKLRCEDGRLQHWQVLKTEDLASKPDK